MKNFLLNIMVISLFLPVQSQSQDIFSDEFVRAIIDRVNNYQLDHPWTEYDDNWIRGTYYTGVMACYQATLDKKYLKQCDKWGNLLEWNIPKLGPDEEGSGANIMTCSQTWLESYLTNPSRHKIKPVIDYLNDPRYKNPTSRPLDYYYEGGLRYVDALFVCPPAFAMLFRITGERKYLEWMDAFFWDVYGNLYDGSENLFYRDIRYRPETGCDMNPAGIILPGDTTDTGSYLCYKKTRNGKKVFWSRGNGWAYAGIVRILKYIPADFPNYSRYLEIYLRMSQELKKRQQENGFWYTNLDDPEDKGYKESSGTGFFSYGLAWGINNGVLSSEEYLPVLERSWGALVSAVSAEGKVQWGQRVGASPYRVSREDTHEYVTGTFLLAASEIFKLKKQP